MNKGLLVCTEIDRANGEHVEALAKHDAADLADTMRHAGTMFGLRSVYTPVPRMCGTAVTLSVTVPSIDLLRVALDLCRAGDVLVVNARGATDQAMLGGHMGYALRNRGVAGVVVDGAVRDPGELQSAGLPVFSRGVTTNGAARTAPGEVNRPVACGGTVVNPGDVIVADGSGLVVVPKDLCGEVLAAADKLVQVHQEWAAEVARGDIFGLAESRQRVIESGCAFSNRGAV